MSDMMWFYDEASEMEEFQAFRKETRRVEKEYLELRVLLRDTEAALRSDPENDELKARVEYLKKRLKDLEKRFSWLTSSSGMPKEVELWGTPHG